MGRDVGRPECYFHLPSGLVRCRCVQVVLQVLKGVFDARIEAGRDLRGGLIGNPLAEAGAKGRVRIDGAEEGWEEGLPIRSS
jgi:hypothetical protein